MHNIGHPPPSGVTTLVLCGASQGVCRHCIIALARCLVEAGGTCVLLVALVTVHPVVVFRERFLQRSQAGRTPRSRQSTHHRREAAVAAASTNFLFVAVSAATEFVSTRLAAVSCCSTAVSLVAASTRLVSAVSRR